MSVAPYTPIYTVEQDGDRFTVGIQHRAVGGPFDDSHWYITDREIMPKTYATREEADAARDKWEWAGSARDWLVPIDTRDYGKPRLYTTGITRAEYEAGCERAGLAPFSEEEIHARRVQPGMTASPWNGHLDADGIVANVQWYWLARRYAGIKEEEEGVARGPLLRCPDCGQTGYAGAYPFSTGYGNGRCDDCG